MIGRCIRVNWSNMVLFMEDPIFIGRLILKTLKYLGYTDSYVDRLSSEWNEKKTAVMSSIYNLLIYVIGFFLGLLYLIVTTGRDSFKDKKVHMHWIDKLYIEIIIFLLFVFSGSWFLVMNEMRFYYGTVNWIIYTDRKSTRLNSSHVSI